MRYVLGRIGTSWYCFGYWPTAKAKAVAAEAVDAGYTEVYATEALFGINPGPSRAVSKRKRP